MIMVLLCVFIFAHHIHTILWHLYSDENQLTVRDSTCQILTSEPPFHTEFFLFYFLLSLSYYCDCNYFIIYEHETLHLAADVLLPDSVSALMTSRIDKLTPAQVGNFKAKLKCSAVMLC
jgi:hypothetical protein